MKFFQVIWKRVNGSRPANTIISGNTFSEAMAANYHTAAINAAERYEIVTPHYLMVDEGLDFPSPLTIFYTQHPGGIVYIKGFRGNTLSSTIDQLRMLSTKQYTSMDKLGYDLKQILAGVPYDY